MGQPEENGLCNVFRVRHAAGDAVGSLEDTGLMFPEDFLKLSESLGHHNVFYRGRQASLLGLSTT
jgi:hypothetical protein